MDRCIILGCHSISSAYYSKIILIGQQVVVTSLFSMKENSFMFAHFWQGAETWRLSRIPWKVLAICRCSEVLKTLFGITATRYLAYGTKKDENKLYMEMSIYSLEFNFLPEQCKKYVGQNFSSGKAVIFTGRLNSCYAILHKRKAVMITNRLMFQSALNIDIGFYLRNDKKIKNTIHRNGWFFHSRLRLLTGDMAGTGMSPVLRVSYSYRPVILNRERKDGHSTFYKTNTIYTISSQEIQISEHNIRQKNGCTSWHVRKDNNTQCSYATHLLVLIDEKQYA
ncbi:hypothetical protein NQ317_003963 [Molorchus minor]|uniref:Uncharacterized protein n=1 Tax=Molorchus minor TaxID=1323400 RepID=A0ABQ9JH95_9CUCU|nr:hypothetical protein NQ317_003963 [Molorchus minor]